MNTGTFIGVIPQRIPRLAAEIGRNGLVRDGVVEWNGDTLSIETSDQLRPDRRSFRLSVPALTREELPAAAEELVAELARELGCEE